MANQYLELVGKAVEATLAEYPGWKLLRSLVLLDAYRHHKFEKKAPAWMLSLRQ